MSTKRIKPSVVIVYTGEGKGKTSAGIGLVCRSLGSGRRVAFVQFIKQWHVSEDTFFQSVSMTHPDQLVVFKGGKGFFQAGAMSAKGVSSDDHRKAARTTFKYAQACATSGKFDLVVCDEINNAAHDGLLADDDLVSLVNSRHPTTSLCLTGRNFPTRLYENADIVTNMSAIRHHYDQGFIANEGIDY